MNNINAPWSIQDSLKASAILACLELGLDPNNYAYHLKEDDRVRHRVSNVMISVLRGRPKPTHLPKVLPNMEATRAFNNSLFYGCYPRKVKNDKDKLEWLMSRGLTPQIFQDLTSVLGKHKGDKNGKGRNNFDIGTLPQLPTTNRPFGFI